ncbi:ABC transporter permease subunit [Paenibacillus sp. LMG 31461]|uniref:ABC transporter permease subunit n=1 Tax=Paenibacillus plantarum TaxID=2654975 RepID=A0ABX1XBN2_9BACL|nr:carbohydrate ABC transporter permease [Paenibacillus plantarum]NOU65389.1 ABC transporter permease subunit [Paenibacillus plantarum]
MLERKTFNKYTFQVFNLLFLTIVSISCVLPLIHILAISFSNSSEAAAGAVKLWPVKFTTDSYSFIMNKPEFLRSMSVTLIRVVLATAIGMALTILCAYPLSKEKENFNFRSIYAWFFVITIIFSGGLIPTYMTIKYIGILDSIWALILPSALPVFNIILLLNFFRGLPKEIEESAFMDGAGYWRAMWSISLPSTKPALATVGLFMIVTQWNSWFDGLIFMNSPDKYPLATYLYSVIKGMDLTKLNGSDFQKLTSISDRTAKAAQIFLGALPVLLVYPFLQRYFVKGIVLGSVKE